MPRKYTKRNTEYWSKGEKPSQEDLLKKVKHMDDAKKQDLGEQEDNLREFVVDGKQRDQEEIKRIKDLEELIGISRSNPFGTLDASIFKSSLEEKTKTDLHNLCIRVGVPPRATIEGTKEVLEREFKSFIANHGSAIPGNIKMPVDPNSEEGRRLKELLEN